jgi:hypothetical protein
LIRERRSPGEIRGFERVGVSRDAIVSLHTFAGDSSAAELIESDSGESECDAAQESEKTKRHE